jgi:GntR family transcriptional regulator
LCQQFGVSRHTVREATRILQMRGLVSRHRGRGTEVLPKQEVSRVSRVLGSIEEVEQHGRDTHLVGIQSKMVVADKTLAMSLSCQPGDRFLHIESYRESRVQDDSWPRAWNETYIREAFEGIREELEGWQGAIYSLVERRYGERITSIRQEVSALNLSERVARKLSVKTGTAGLRVKRTYHGQAGEALLFGFNTYVGSRFSLIMDIKSHD